jgi:hypothetical protein
MRNLCIVLHTLSPVQNVAQVESATELKKIILSAKHRGWDYSFPGDKSWFYFTVSRAHISPPEEGVTPIRPRETASFPKGILTIFWFRLGFHSSSCRRKGNVLILGTSARMPFKKSIEIV